MTGAAMNDRLAAALEYLGRGWSVLPVEPRGKRPLVRWRALEQRAASAKTIRQWFDATPDANIGIVTGAISGIVVVDVDKRHGGDESLALLERAHGALPPTVEVLTGGGGRHLYFRHPGVVLTNRVNLWPGIDLRGDGGCIVAPPSIHPSGLLYAWAGGRAPADTPIARLPHWLLAAALAHDQGHSPRR
jgi:hypothetical protein